MIKNLAEEFVAREYERLRPTQPDFCGCDMCREDVIVFALNRVSPRYAVQEEGEIISRVKLEADQPRTDVYIAVMEAFRRVSAEPRHERADAKGGGS